MRRRALSLSLLVAAVGGSTLAFASSLNGVTAAKLTAYSAASTVPTSSCSSNATKDTWVDSAHKNTQHATGTTLTVTGTGSATWALVQFTPCAPANAAIVSASLQMYLRTSPGSRTYGAYLATSTWAETATWNSRPSTNAAPTSTAATGAGGSTTTWSLAGDVQSMVNGGANNGWAVEDAAAGTASGSYDSREGTNPPVLAITYYP